MDAAQKKQFTVKCKAVSRTMKEYRNYQKEFDAYDINVVSQDKRQNEFYNESKLALEQVGKNLMEYATQLNSWLEDNQAEIMAEESLQKEREAAQLELAQVQSLFPGGMAFSMAANL